MLTRLTLVLLAVVAATATIHASAQAARPPLRLPSGEPFVGVYFFPHWWDPWKSDDDAMRRDLRRLKTMGVNTLLVDHEWSQAIDGNWNLLDRGNRLAQECGMAVVPWLSPKTWSDITPGHREKLAQDWFGVQVKWGRYQDGKPAPPVIWDKSILTAGTKYTLMYLDRYLKGPILRLKWNGRVRPVVSLSVESAWDGGFDDASNARFRAWARRRYEDIGKANAAWGTRLAAFDAIDPRDTAVFDYKGHMDRKAAHPRAVEDHVAFRSATVRDVLRQTGKAVRRKHPDVLFMAEYPYQYEGVHPHADRYRIAYGANPESCDWADIVLLRLSGPLTASEVKALERHERRTGQKFVIAFRTYSDWDVLPSAPSYASSVELYAGQAAKHGAGFGFYSFNEMVDTHVAYSAAMPVDEKNPWTNERAERALGLMGAMVKRYRELAR